MGRMPKVFSKARAINQPAELFRAALHMAIIFHTVSHKASTSMSGKSQGLVSDKT